MFSLLALVRRFSLQSFETGQETEIYLCKYRYKNTVTFTWIDNTNVSPRGCELTNEMATKSGECNEGLYRV